MPEIVARKGCSHSTQKFTDRRLMYKQLSITWLFWNFELCVCLILFCLFHSLLSVFCRTLAEIPSGNWGGCLSETILNDFFCVPEAIFKGFSLHPNTVIESDGRIPWTSRPAGRQFARQFKKMAKRSGRTAENCKRTRLDPKETIRLGKSRSDSVGERLCQLFEPTRFF